MEDETPARTEENYLYDAQVEAMQRRVDAVLGKPDEADPYTIFRLAASVRERYKELYEPKVVSVGPYYHGKDVLKAMEEYKWRLLRDFLSRNTDTALTAYVREVRALEAKARRCYSESFDMGVDAFVEMLVLDGCFVLEFFLKKSEGQLAAPGSAKWTWHHIYSDLLLMENQIPFFVVEKLHDLAFAGQDGGGRDALLDLFCKLFSGDLPSSRVIRPPSEKTIHHLLHLHHECNVRNPAANNTPRNGAENNASLAIWRQPPIPSPRSADRAMKARPASMIPSATKLEAAGVTFKRKASPRDMFDISFRYAVLQMPTFVVDESAKVLFANLVAFEQSGDKKLDGANLVTGFVALVGSLINTQRDVEILRRCGIMHCMLTDDEAVRYFNHVVQYTTMDYDQHLFACLFRDVRDHCHSTWYA